MRRSGIAGSLHATLGRTREVAIQSLRCIRQLAQGVFEVTTYFVDAGDVLDRTVGRIESLDRLIACNADLSNHALIFGFTAKTRLPVVSKITSANGIPRNCRPSSSNHVIN